LEDNIDGISLLDDHCNIHSQTYDRHDVRHIIA